MVTKSMNSNDYKVLYQKAEKDKIKNVVQKLKESYDKYEKGKIDFKDLKDVIVSDLKLSTTENFEKLTNSAGRDNKTFAGLVKSLGILKDEKSKAPVFSANQIKESTTKKFHRYVRNKSYNVPEHNDDAVQSIVNAFIKRQINSQELHSVLRENNINPNVEEINKYVRSHDSGISIKFNDFLFAIKKVNNNGIDPSTVKFDINTPKYFTTHTEKPELKGKRGKENPSYYSNKEFYDWEVNEQKHILSKTDAKPMNQTTKTKFIFDSSLFKKDEVKKDEKKSALKKVDAPLVENGNILTWKVRNGEKVDSAQIMEIKRRNPNVSSNTDESTKAPKKKLLRMHEPSEENGLIRKK